MDMRPTLADLVREGVDAARAYLNADADTRTVHVRDLADVLIDIRELFDDPEGRGPDYAGRSQSYRAAVHEIYRALEGEVPPAQITRLRNTARYHAGAALRERVDPDVLARYGLLPESGRDRNRIRTTRRRELIRSVEDVVDSDGDPRLLAVRITHRAQRLLSLLDADGIRRLPHDVRQSVDAALARVIDAAVRLRGAAESVDTLRRIDDILGRYTPDQRGADRGGDSGARRAVEGAASTAPACRGN